MVAIGSKHLPEKLFGLCGLPRTQQGLGFQETGRNGVAFLEVVVEQEDGRY